MNAKNTSDWILIQKLARNIAVNTRLNNYNETNDWQQSIYFIFIFKGC